MENKLIEDIQKYATDEEKKYLLEYNKMFKKLKPEDFGITKYKFNPDGTLNVFDDVILNNRNLTKLPFKFGKIDGDFICQKNDLKSLSGLNLDGVSGEIYVNGNPNLKLTEKEQLWATLNPGKIIDFEDRVYKFRVGSNKLTSLKGAPKKIRGDLNDNSDYFKSLDGMDKDILNGLKEDIQKYATKKELEFLLEYNSVDVDKVKPEDFNITKYKFRPDGTLDVFENVDLWSGYLIKLPFNFGKIFGNFDCSGNKLKDLKGCPEEVNGSFSCSDNNLINLKGCPKIIKGDFWCRNNDLISLEGLNLDNIYGKIFLMGNPDLILTKNEKLWLKLNPGKLILKGE